MTSDPPQYHWLANNIHDKIEASNATFVQAWAIVEKDRGNYDQATLLFEAGVRADPNHLYLWQAWGCMEVEQVSVNRKRAQV